MQSCRSRKGGWWSGSFRQTIDTRECFYTFWGLMEVEKGIEELKLFVKRLTDDMNTKGQVPSSYYGHWFRGELPRYRSNFEEVPIVDSNMFYIILLWEMHEKEISVDKYYISAQRAYQFLDKYVAEDTFYEPKGASWESTREHNSHLLLTNVIMARTIRCMELLALINKDIKTKDSCIQRYGKFIEKLQPQLYRTQEVLPRILGICWNMVPDAFLPSFNQDIESNTWIPLRTNGPVEITTTTRSMILGRSDMHTEIIWPFVGFLWIIILEKRGYHQLAKKWWISYMDFHSPRTIHNMYCPYTGKPIRRAFVQSEPMHVSTISLYFAARHRIDQGMLDQDV